MAIIYGMPDAEKRFLKKLPKEVESIDDISRVHKEMKQEFDLIGKNGFKNYIRRWNKNRQIEKISKNKGSPLHHGAKGEITVLEKLSELDDTHHVLCGLRINLGHYVTYHGLKNLKSAQVDFVVVSKRGIFCIEAKNWTDNYVSENKKYGGIIPHEQVDRAGLVLWIALQSWWNPKKPSVNRVILSTKGNIHYDAKYQYVDVKNLNNINQYIQSRYERFSEKDVERIIDRLKIYVTT